MMAYGDGKVQLLGRKNHENYHFNLDAGNLTIHDGKKKKDRTLPLPEVILPEIHQQFEAVRLIKGS